MEPTPEEVQAALAVLKKLRKCDIQNHEGLEELGVELFTRAVKKKLFGDESVSSFLKDKYKQRQTLRQLEKIHNDVQRSHADFVESARCSGINVIRESRSAEVNSKGLAALSTQAALETLKESQTLSALSIALTWQPSVAGLISSEDNNTNDPFEQERERNCVDGADSAPFIRDDVMTAAPLKHDAFRMGGIGRSRGRNGVFDRSKVRGMYDEPDMAWDEVGPDGLVVRKADGQGQDQATATRREGEVFFAPREIGAVESGWLCYVRDAEDGTLRACALRTVVDLSDALAGLEYPLVAGVPLRHACTYVIGLRKQRWALLGGEVPDLSGETAISVRLAFPHDPSPHVPGSLRPPQVHGQGQGRDGRGSECGENAGEGDSSERVSDTQAPRGSVEKEGHAAGGHEGEGVGNDGNVAASQESCGRAEDFVVPPMGSFRRHCNTCKHPYLRLHPFYHQLCGRCGDFNLQKRLQTADLTGYLCLVTGGRVRIGYQICLKLLRAGATVITTTRWPKDAALRYSHEHDWSTWRRRLSIEALELADTHAVEQFCDRLTQKLTPTASSPRSDEGAGSQDTAPGRDREGEDGGAGVDASGFGGAVLGPRLHVLINNAAQTITRPVGWKEKMARLDVDTHALLRDEARGMIADAPHIIPVSGKTAVVHPVNNPFTGNGITLAHAPPADEPSPSPLPEGKEPPHGDSDGKELGAGKLEDRSEEEQQEQKEAEEVVMVVSGANRKSRAKDGSWITLDESGQPLDLSGVNSWSRRLGDVGTQELCETFAVNAIAPFILCSRLKGVLAPRSGTATIGGRDGQSGAAAEGQGGENRSGGEEARLNSDGGEARAEGAKGAERAEGAEGMCENRGADIVAGSVRPASREGLLLASGHVVNVTALEGKFNVGKKSTGHPHTNMAKAALNMLTLTSARDLAHSGIYMSSVDTGWVTDMSPGGVGSMARIHETFVGPPLDDEDGAARVLDPVFSHVNSNGAVKMYGHFYKDYMKASW